MTSWDLNSIPGCRQHREHAAGLGAAHEPLRGPLLRGLCGRLGAALRAPHRGQDDSHRPGVLLGAEDPGARPRAPTGEARRWHGSATRLTAAI